MEDLSQLKSSIEQLLKQQKLAVLSTQGPEGPYGSLVAFAETPDLKYLFFATTRSTRKYANLASNPGAALLIDNRSNLENDFYRAKAVTAIGAVEEVQALEKEALLKVYLEKHPQLREFATSPGCALIRITVGKYFLVSRFQNVQELHLV
jgi:nitroimidazol reductase NimA-like FMN-containing flavoprotein (pyridoxamine 5'-phosphate oxidase superfamily)